MSRHFRKASIRQKGAHHPGTVTNRHRAVRLYTRFARRAGFRYDKPTIPAVCAFNEFMAETHKSPKSVRNVLCSLRTHFKMAHIKHSCMDSIQVANAIRALELQVCHIPNQKRPVNPESFTSLVRELQQDVNGDMLVLGVVIMFNAMLRQSNLFPHSVAAFDPHRHLCVKDIAVSANEAQLTVKWSKTLQIASDARTITLHRIRGSPLCPLRALRRAGAVRCDRSPNRPLLQYADG